LKARIFVLMYAVISKSTEAPLEDGETPVTNALPMIFKRIYLGKSKLG